MIFMAHKLLNNIILLKVEIVTFISLLHTESSAVKTMPLSPGSGLKCLIEPSF